MGFADEKRVAMLASLREKYSDKKYVMLSTADMDGLKQVMAIRDFGDVKAGSLGGLVQGEHNLSQKGKCWITAGVVVKDSALVQHDAVLECRRMPGKEIPDGLIVVSGSAVVCDTAHVVFDDIGLEKGCKPICICDSASVSGSALVRCNEWYDTRISGKSKVYGHAEVQGVHVSDRAEIFGDASVTGYRDKQIVGNSEPLKLMYSSKVFDNATVIGSDGVIDRDARICGNSKFVVTKREDPVLEVDMSEFFAKHQRGRGEKGSR